MPSASIETSTARPDVTAMNSRCSAGRLQILSPKARDDLRRVLIRDQADRDRIASELMRYRDGRGDDWADIIDMLTMWPKERRKVARLLGEIDASESR
jgi:hypothetical protein